MGRGFRPRRGAWIFLVTAVFALLAPFSPATAASYTVTEESDWYFTIEQDQTLAVIYGNSNSSCDDYEFADPHLWLYDDIGTLIADDDDGNHNWTDQCLSSKLYVTLNAGDYRLRAGYCCEQLGLGNKPDIDGSEYELITEFSLIGTTTTTTTTTSSTTTTTNETTTTSEPQSIGPPMNLTGELTEQGVFLDWDAPNSGNIQPERYAIAFRVPPGGGWGVATENVGGERALIT